MGYKLYPHQKTQLKDLKVSLEDHQHIIFGAPTGWGKSVALESIVAEQFALGKRVLVLAPTIKLVNQLYKTLAKYNPKVHRGNDKRGHNQRSPKVTLAGLDTMASRLRGNERVFGDIDFILMDECHISGNFNEQTIKKSRMSTLYKLYWDRATWIGLSATPMNQKWKKLVGWDAVLYKTQTQDLIDNGYLANFIYRGTKKDLLSAEHKVVKSNGGYDMTVASKELTTPATLDRVIATLDEYKATEHKTLIFCASIEHAEAIHELVPSSMVVHSKEAQANATIEAFEKMKSGILINVDILTTGFDDPTIDLVILARPIRTIRLAIQVWGRGLRKYGNKVTTFVDLCGVYADCGSPSTYRDYTEEGNKTVGDAIYRCCTECEGVDLSGKWTYTRHIADEVVIIQQGCPMCGFVTEKSEKQTSVPPDVILEDSREIKKAMAKEQAEQKAKKKAKKKKKKARKEKIESIVNLTRSDLLSGLKGVIYECRVPNWKVGKAYYLIKDLYECGEGDFLQLQVKLFKMKEITNTQLLYGLDTKIKEHDVK